MAASLLARTEGDNDSHNAISISFHSSLVGVGVSFLANHGDASSSEQGGERHRSVIDGAMARKGFVREDDGERAEWYEMNVSPLPMAVGGAVLIVGRNVEGWEIAEETDAGYDTRPVNLVLLLFWFHTLLNCISGIPCFLNNFRIFGAFWKKHNMRRSSLKNMSESTCPDSNQYLDQHMTYE
jgi:hypothetical protein